MKHLLYKLSETIVGEYDYVGKIHVAVRTCPVLLKSPLSGDYHHLYLIKNQHTKNFYSTLLLQNYAAIEMDKIRR